MLTVLAIDKNLICELDDFESLFSNVEKKGEFKICSWNREGNNLFEAIPALFDRHFISENELRSWNIMIVSDNRKCTADNPFSGDYLNDKENLPDPELNEIAKMLGIVPTDSHSWYELPDNKFGTIKWNVEVNRNLRDEKLQQYNIMEFSRPQKIFLFSVVCKNDVDVDEFSKKNCDATERGTFRVKAKYPVNCRFLRFNLSSISNVNTKEDYFRLWMTLLTFVYNDADSIYLSPDALYNIDSVIDKKIMQTQISAIYSKVHYVKKLATLRISDIEKMREHMKQKHYDVPNLNSDINVEFNTDDSGLYLNKKRFGLAKNCPCEDTATYRYQREGIEKRIFDFLKAPKRALKRAVSATKSNGIFHPDSEEKIHLDEDQTEDLIDNINDLELKLFGSDAVDSAYEQRNEKARQECDKENYKTMHKRATVSVIILGSVAAFCSVLLGFVPYIINAFVSDNDQTIADSFMITFASLFVLCIAGIITILILRIPLSKGLKKFHAIIKLLVDQTNDLADQYTAYLSKLSSFMKSNSFNTYLHCNNNVYLKDEENKLRKNLDFSEKREQMCQKWAEEFDFKLQYNEKHMDSDYTIDDYPEKNPLYSFRLNYGDFRVLLNQKRSNLITPYQFISSINIVREEDD